jgi:uncharacterized protein
MFHSKCCGGKGGVCVGAMIGKVLLIVGGLNWGLIGVGMLFGNTDSWNLVEMIFGSVPYLVGIIYVLVGLAAIMKLFRCPCKKCKDACASCCVEEENKKM